MKRLLRSFLSLVGVFAATALFTGAIPESSPAAGNTVLVLPFQVSAGPLLPDASQAVPQAVIDKIHDLLHVLNEYQPDIKLYVVPFTELERKIYEVAGPSYCVTVMRRMMMRIAERIANKHNDLILSSGESIGQVASQTLPSMKVIEECCHLPMVRPLACTDKSEIIQIAKDIGTYDISIRPFEDCCTIFTLKDPVTHPSLEVVNKIESEFDWQTMVSDCVKNTTAEHVTLEEEF